MGSAGQPSRPRTKPFGCWDFARHFVTLHGADLSKKHQSTVRFSPYAHKTFSAQRSGVHGFWRDSHSLDLQPRRGEAPCLRQVATLEKIARLRRLFPDLTIEVDGGLKPDENTTGRCLGQRRARRESREYSPRASAGRLRSVAFRLVITAKREQPEHRGAGANMIVSGTGIFGAVTEVRLRSS